LLAAEVLLDRPEGVLDGPAARVFGGHVGGVGVQVGGEEEVVALDPGHVADDDQEHLLVGLDGVPQHRSGEQVHLGLAALASAFVSHFGGLIRPHGNGLPDPEGVRSEQQRVLVGDVPEPTYEEVLDPVDEVRDLAAADPWRGHHRAGGVGRGGGSLDDHPGASGRQGGRAGGVGGLEAGVGKTSRDVELEEANAEIVRLSEAVKELAVKLTVLEVKGGSWR